MGRSIPAEEIGALYNAIYHKATVLPRVAQELRARGADEALVAGVDALADAITGAIMPARKKTS